MTTITNDKQQALPYPNHILGKMLFKAPLFMIRLGLQPLMGNWFMVITHTGRKSGQPRHTMTEMHRSEEGKIYAPCGYGEKAQWYKNIVADSRVTVQIAQHTFSAHARRVTDDDELVKVIALMNSRNGFIETFLSRLSIENTPESIIANKDKLYFIAFDETTDTTPPPLDADLKWVWILVLLLIIWRINQK